MIKKMKIAAGFLTVIICILLGCERREREPEALFLEEASKEEGSGGISSEQGETKGVSPEASETEGNGQQTLKENITQVFAGPEKPTEPENCVVHICGAVNAPGVYTLERGGRIYQAIEKAGGFREDAEQDYLNQADLLADGMKIYVPTQSEVQEAAQNSERMISGGGMSGNIREEKAKEAEEGFPVNINTAGEEQLCTLPGVGSSKAKSIIAYREQNGAYRTIEEIMNVEGIKDGVFRKIKDSITV